VSRNLTLRGTHEEFTLVQTPTEITDLALRVAGNASAAVGVYEGWLRSCRMWLDEDDCVWFDDYAPGWSWDPITRHIARVNAFIAFAPGARFHST